MKRYLVKVVQKDKDKFICEDINLNRIALPDHLMDTLCGDVLELISDNKVKKLHDSSKETACLFVTNHCNSNCIMCPDSEIMRRQDEKIDMDFLKDYIKLLPSDLPHLDVTGGEPTLLRYGLPELLKLVFEHFELVSVMLLTNGRAFADKNYSSLFAEFNKTNLLIEIPVHGPDACTHDKISGSQGSFRQTIVGVHNLLYAGCRVGIRIVVSKLNIENIESITKLVYECFPEIQFINYMGLEMLGNARINMDQVWIEFEELKAVVEKSIELCFAHGIEPRLYNFPLCLFNKKYWSLYRKSISLHKVVYLEGCNNCSIRQHCGGFFRSTASITLFAGRQGSL